MKTRTSILKSLMVYMLINSMSVNAQIKITPSGYLGIGTTSPLIKFHYVGDFAGFTNQTTPGAPQSAAVIKCNKVYSSPNSNDYTWWGDGSTGIFHSANSRFGLASGGFEIARVDNVTQQYQFSIFGSAYCSSGSWTGSDIRYKRNINTLQSSLTKVLKLRGVDYEYNREEYKNLNFSEGKTIGFIAQELKEVVPELVKEDDKGFLSVNYTGIIPMMVEAIKEQQQQIDELKHENAEIKKKTSSFTGINSLSLIDGNYQMSQNEPNPFTHETVVKYTLPTSVANAFMAVYDLTGKQITTFPIDQKGSASITLTSEKLAAGIYIYSIVADGKVVDSKRMIVAEK